MKEENNTSKKTIGNATMPFDTNDFIRQVSVAGSKEDIPKPMQASKQAERNVCQYPRTHKGKSKRC